MKYVFDIDGTICDKNENDDYDRHNNNAQLAIQEFYALTEAQLGEWGVKYHQLILGKPSGDLYIDDKGVKDGEFFINEIRP